MVSVSDSTKHFALFLVGACVMLAGAGAFFGLHDQDWNYAFDRAEEEYPRNEGDLGYYEDLPPEQREIVDRAIDGERVTFEDDGSIPPGVVRKDDTYYVFDTFTTMDFGHPGTTGPILVGLAGTAVVVDAARRDVRN